MKKVTTFLLLGIVVGVIVGLFAKKEQTLTHSPKKFQKELQASVPRPNISLKEIKKVVTNSEATKEELLDITIAGQDYDEQDPHSFKAIQAQKQGAFKVIALKRLIETEKNIEGKLQTLNHVIMTAKDPTIQRVAQSYRESLKNGRSFFRDFKQAVGNLPIPN